MFISVIPTSKSLGKSPYIYFVGETWKDQIEVGGLVEVPLGKNLILGVISGKSELSPGSIAIEDIRPIHSVISNTSLLTAGMIASVLSLADRYFLLIHKALGLFLPASLMTRLEKRSYALDFRESEDTQQSNKVSIHHYIHHTFSPADLREYEQDEAVFIFPDDTMLAIFTKEWGKDKDRLILTNSATPTRKSQSWIDIYEGKYTRIAGTRRLLYYNLSRYKHIIYVEDAFGSEHYQYPITIKTLDTLSLLAKYSHQDITIVTSTPSLDLFALFSDAHIISKK